ncbi:MAG: hypothetical protein OEV59_00870 [Deltaproteobacteria bacterium]|nr:hypothetical protein [Deltaproteobacteria bacterium]
MVKLKALILALLVMSPALAFADMLNDASAFVEDFYNEETSLIKGLPAEKDALERIRLKKEEAVAELKKLRLSGVTGKKLYKKASDTVSGYAASETERVKKLLSDAKTGRGEEASKKLLALKDELMGKLKKSYEQDEQSAEKRKTTEPPPVPSVDTSPHEKRPGTPQNIWTR